jgi:zinc protease
MRPAAATNVANSGGASWPYTDFGPRGQIASRDHVDDLDVTRVTFANGVRATIKPTKYRAGQVLITVSFGNGRLGLPKDRKTASWALGVFASGGLGKLDVDSIHRLLASKAWGAGFSVSDDCFNLAGSTRPEDYETELQLLTAYLNDPGWRPQAFERAQTSMVAALKEADAMPGGVYALQAPAIAHGGDARWTTPSIDEVKGARLEDARALLGPALERGPVEVTVVGDIAVDDALKGLAQTFGALDRRFTAPAEIAGDERLPPPSGAPLALRHRGGKDQAIAFIAWPTQGLLPDAREARTLKVLELVMSQRLFDVLRTQEGMTYTPSLDSDNSLATPAYGYLSVATEIPPGKVPEFYAAIDRSIAGLKEKEISGDELARARDPHVEDIIHAQETNQYWLEVLRHSQADPRWFDLVRSTVPDLKAVTATDVLNAARTYLSDDRSWKLVVRPKDEGATAGGAP